MNGVLSNRDLTLTLCEGLHYQRERSESMYHITIIGQIEWKNYHVYIRIIEECKRGLRHAESFSHMHLVYGDFALEESNKEKLLKHNIIKIEKLDRKEGLIVGEVIFPRSVETQQKSYLYDLKPYFPCEDRVITLEEFQNSFGKNQCLSQERVITTIHDNSTSCDSNHMEHNITMCGKIRVLEGQTYIECSKEKVKQFQDREVIRVFWWFHRFDKKNYRKVAECDPPYENAPRVGTFASRSPVRPNPIAMTTARIIRVDELNGRIYVNALDCFDMTPCINVLPYVNAYDFVERVEVAEWVKHWPDSWVEEKPVFEDVSTKNMNSKNMSEKNLDKKNLDKKNMDRNDLITEESILDLKDNESPEYEMSFEDFIHSRNQGKLMKKHKNTLLQQLKETKIEKEPCLSVYGAYENNLKRINVSIPYQKITALVGVSGSGKSSLAFDTIYAECQRRFADLEGSRELLPKPKISRMTGVIPAIAISQQAIGKNTRSTVGTYSDLYDDLRSIFSTIGVRHCPNCGQMIAPMTMEEMMNLFQPDETVEVFNLDKELVSCKTLRERLEKALRESHGACYVKVDHQFIMLQTRQMCYRCNQVMFHLTPATFNYIDSESYCKCCNGRGIIVEISEATIVQDKKKSLLDGASSLYKGLREFQKHPNANWMIGEVLGLAQKLEVDLELPYEQLPEQFKTFLLNGTGEDTVTFHYVNEKNGRNGSICRPVEGAISVIKRIYSKNGDVYPINQFVLQKECPVCNGERLSKEARLVTVGGVRYPQIAQMTFTQLFAWCSHISEQVSDSDYAKIEATVTNIARVCQVAHNLGIDYLSLNRDTLTLSGGEKKRLKLLSNLAANISGILYVIDEPTAGLNVKDYDLLKEMLHTIKARGNTILMVEHSAKMIKEADKIIEIGPGAGIHGGEIIENGPIVASLSELPARVLPLKDKLDFEKGLQFQNISYRNLKDVTFTIPLHAITCIHGVSGSGKSSMLEGVIYERVCKDLKPFSQVCYVDQQPIGRNLRSSPATYLKLMDEIRKIFSNLESAKRLGFKEAVFSYNSLAGQCDCCRGIGQINPEFMPDVWITCPACQGSRYKSQVLEVTYQGYTIADVLEFSIEKAKEVFVNEAKLQPILQLLCDVSLEYLIMGQSTTTLSGGEAQRLKLVNELMTQTKKNTLYLLDEPTSGLSRTEVIELLKLFHQLVEDGNTIVLIEHNEEVLINCDYQIELGPKAGDEGGRIISQLCLISS